MEQGVEDGKVDEEVEVIVCLGIVIGDQGYNGVLGSYQVVKDYIIQDVFILKLKLLLYIEILSFEIFFL